MPLNEYLTTIFERVNISIVSSVGKISFGRVLNVTSNCLYPRVSKPRIVPLEWP